MLYEECYARGSFLYRYGGGEGLERERALSMNLTVERLLGYIMESLILAQNKRWRRVLSMQVERQGGVTRPRAADW